MGKTLPTSRDGRRKDTPVPPENRVRIAHNTRSVTISGVAKLWQNYRVRLVLIGS
jgi:hypothetical protein